MNTLERLEAGFLEASRRGDDERARLIGQEIRRLQQEGQAIQPEPIRGGTREQQEAQLNEIAQIRYGESGRDVDIRTGAPLSVRLAMSFAPTEPEKEQYLKKVYGENNVRRAGDDNRLVFTAVDQQTGQMKDFFADELGFSAKDIADVAGVAPEVLTSIATAFKVAPSAPNTKAGFLAVSAISELAGQQLGAAQDMAFRFSQGTLNMDSMREMAKRRGLHAFIGTGIGAALPAGVQAMARAIPQLPRLSRNPLSPEGTALQQISSEGTAAAKRLEGALGESVFTSAAEETGSKGLAQVEAYASRVSRMSNPDEALQLSRERVPVSVQSMLLQGLEEPGVFGQQVSSRLAGVERQLIERGGAEIDKAYASVLNRLESEIGSLTAPPQGVVQAGTNARNSLVARMAVDRAQAEQLYGRVDDLLTQSGMPTEFVRLNESAALSREIIENLVKDTSGRPIPMQTELMSQLAPLAEAGSVPQTLAAARRFRSRIGERIGSDQEIGPGFSKGDAKRLYEALSRDIDSSIGALSKEAQAAAKEANQFYKTNVALFEESPIISRVLNSQRDGGYPVEDIARAFAAGRGNLTELQAAKKLLPPEVFAGLRRGIIDDIVNGSTRTYRGQEYIDPSAFGRRINDMSPEFRAELFGSREGAARVQSLVSEVNELDAIAPKLARPAGLNAAQVSEVANAADNAGFVEAKRNVMRSLAIERQRTRTFQNNVASANGDVLETMLRDGERFVEDFILSNNNSGQVKKVLGRLTPAQREQVGKQTMAILFKRATDLSESTVSAIKTPSRPAAIKGEQILKDIYGPQRTVLRDLISPRDLQILDDWLIYNHSMAATVRAGGTVGVFSRDLAFGNPLKVAYQNLWGQIVFSAPGQQFMKAMVRNPNDAKKLGDFIVSTSGNRFATGGLVSAGVSAPEITSGLLDLYEKWDLMTANMTQAEKDLLVVTYIPFAGPSGKKKTSRR
jgi:hypothetical protein